MNPLPGFRDFYPEALAVRRYIFDKWRDVARRYGFREYDGPPLEPLELYTQKSGDEIVGQLFNFVDKGDRAVALRPEMTPTLARMVGAHHRDYKKPIKWFAIPQLFRYEKQQRGRLREHFQFNADIIGETDVSADAELIALAIDTLRSFGLTERDFVVRVNDRHYATSLFEERFRIPLENHQDILAIIDKVERVPKEITKQKIQALALSGLQKSQLWAFFESDIFGEHGVIASELQQVFNILESKGLRDYVKADLKIVRGLAYYTGIVWEIHDCKGELRAVAGGGRYDNLLKQVSGVDMPALGFGMGDVVLGELLKDRGLLPGMASDLDCYIVIADESLRQQAIGVVHNLRDSHFAVEYSLRPTRVGKQFQLADEMRAKYAIVIGLEEWQASEVKLKSLTTGQEMRVKITELATLLHTTPWTGRIL
jgi:histidyl-tRNA synthetase